MLGKGVGIEIEKSHFQAHDFEIDGLKKSSKNVNRTAVKWIIVTGAWDISKIFLAKRGGITVFLLRGTNRKIGYAVLNA